MAEEPEENVARLAEAVLDDSTLTDWQKRLGLELRVGSVFNQTVSYEAIRNFSNGIGDINPLYREEEYVKKTEGGETILYINKYYEKNLDTGEVTTYYYLGERLVAMREGTTLKYLHQEHR